MGNISANTLFHFTKQKDHLINILINGFYPKYCMENLEFAYNENFHELAPTQIAIPMNCFCDIPLSQISSHVKKYGPYAIGLTKEWGEKNGINPVLYELPNSNPIKIIRESIRLTIPFIMGQYYPEDHIYDIDRGLALHSIGKQLLFFAGYIKPYEGRNWNGKNFTGDKIRFYDEREWRYVPDYDSMVEKDIKPYLPIETFKSTKELNKNQEKIEEHFQLHFTPSDIKYILVEKESEVPTMIWNIERIKCHFSYDEQKLLMTKIISLDRINDDF